MVLNIFFHLFNFYVSVHSDGLRFIIDGFGVLVLGVEMKRHGLLLFTGSSHAWPRLCKPMKLLGPGPCWLGLALRHGPQSSRGGLCQAGMGLAKPGWASLLNLVDPIISKTFAPFHIGKNRNRQKPKEGGGEVEEEREREWEKRKREEEEEEDEGLLPFSDDDTCQILCTTIDASS